MYLTYRLANAADIETCLDLLPGTIGYEETLRTRLPAIWCDWLRTGALQMAILEDTGSQEPGIVAFGSSVFITDEFVEKMKSDPKPHVSARLAREFVSGKSSLLPEEAIARDNAGDGLNLLVLHIGWPSEAMDESNLRMVKDKLLQLFHLAHDGYQLKGIFQEVYSESEMKRALATGTRLLADYTDFYNCCGAAPPPPCERPYLVGIQRGQVEDGTMISSRFFYSPPRFFFKKGEQQVLQRALLGQTDEQIAAALSLSLYTVRKRWVTIYERVCEVVPDLLPDRTDTAAEEQKMGLEKKSHLLSYLRQHLEELRPYAR